MDKSLKAEILSGNSGIIVPANAAVRVEFKHWITRDGVDLEPMVDTNIVVNEGLDHILGVALANVTQNTTWYLGLFKNNYTPVAADVAATFPTVGFADEANAEYDELTRPTYVTPGVSAQALTNSAAPGTFTFNTNQDIYGAFLISDSTKGATTGVLCSASRFASVRSMQTTDVLNVQYDFTIADV